MIAFEDPVSPHESTTKDVLSPESAAARVHPVAPMAKVKAKKNAAHADAVLLKKDPRADDDDDFEDADGPFDSDGSDFDDDKHSDELRLLSLDSFGHDDLCSDITTPTTTTTAAATTPKAGEAKATAPAVGSDGAPVKRILRRKRKRMSEDERRIRHREVQRQFMKRKRARLGEMRKFLRGVESQHRLVQVMHERDMLEKENGELRERLASPGSGWQWDDAPASTSPSHGPPEPHVVHLVPEHGLMAFHHLPHAHTDAHTQHYGTHQPQLMHVQHLPHLQHAGHMQHIEHPHHQAHLPSRHLHHHQMLGGRHQQSHRPNAPGVPLPWDDILDAVTHETHGGAFHDISF